MEGKASKKRYSGSKTQQSGAAKLDSSSLGGQIKPRQSDGPGHVDSNTGGVVQVANTSAAPGFREIYVQYIPGKPHALTEFGAFLHSHQDQHEFRAIDGSGLAKKVGLRNRDVLVSINNIQANVTNAKQLAILECFSDVGTSIGLVVQRKPEETWLFAFHLNEKDNRPVVENIFSKRITNECQTSPIIPVHSAFVVTPVYSYQRAIPGQVQIIMENSSRYMDIGTEIATYVQPRRILMLNIYEREDGGNPGGLPVAISIPYTLGSECHSGSGDEPDSDDEYGGRPMCIKGIRRGPLRIVVFPRFMRQRGRPIPQNNLFFIMIIQPNGVVHIRAANTQEELYITSSSQGGNRWIASLDTSPAPFNVVANGRKLTSREEILKLLK